MKKLNLVVVMLVSAAATLMAQPEQKLPLDPRVRYGKLDNGLTYYIQANQQPKGRAEFHIAQNVGAVLEEDSQNGLAHFLEHMAFNGSEHFPEKGIINYFETVGVRFGQNINAYTSVERTVYRLSDVPTDRVGILDTALLVLYDWSCAISLLEDEIDAERGVIREEWRQGFSAARRMRKELTALKYPGSRFAVRDVIGDTAVINNFTYDQLRNYYKHWYRPDQQAIIVIGDINVDDMEQKVKTLFGKIPKSEFYGIRPIFGVEPNDKPIVAIVTDPEATSSAMSIEFKLPATSNTEKLGEGYFGKMIANYAIQLVLGERFQEITANPESPIVRGYGYFSPFYKAMNVFAMNVVPREGMEKAAFDLMLEQTEKVKRYGFTESEYERAKAIILTMFEQSYNERNNEKNIDFATAYISNFTDQQPAAGTEWEYNWVKTNLPNMPLEFVNDLVKSYLSSNQIIVSVMGPEKANSQYPSKDEVLNKLAAIDQLSIEAPKGENKVTALVEKTPKAGKIKRVTKNITLGTTEWVLSNGVKVIFKPTTFKQDEVLMSAFSKGGFSQVADVNQLPSAMTATSIVFKSGIGAFNDIELRKVLSGKYVNVNPYISSEFEGIDGMSSVKDFETMMQLTYLYFTAPREDEAAFEAYMNATRTSVANRTSNPTNIFRDSVRVVTSNHSSRTIIFDTLTLAKVTLPQAMSIYKERFAVPSDFTFVFTGNLDPDNADVKRILLTYLGGIKSKKITEEVIDRGDRTPVGKVDCYFNRGMTIKKASNFIMYSAAMPYTFENEIKLDVLASVLRIRYLESIREKEGGSYGVGVGSGLSKYPVEEAALRIQFDTDPLKQQRLMAIVHQEVATIVAEGPRVDDLQKVKEGMLKKFEQDVEENSFWNDVVLSYYRDGIDTYNTYRSYVNSITPEMIKACAEVLVGSGNCVEVVMQPQE